MKNTVTVILCFFLLACQPENLLVEIEPPAAQVVVSSQLLPGGSLIVFLTRSFTALEGNEDSLSQDFLRMIVVENALVTVSSGAGLDTLTGIEGIPGIYITTDSLPLDSELLALNIFDSLTGSQVSAVTSILPPVIPDSLAFFEEVNGEDTIESIYYAFDDPPFTENWYAVNVLDPTNLFLSLESNPFNLLGEGNGTVHERLISDRTLTEHRFERVFELDQRTATDTLAFWFTNVSEGYFRFLDARRRTGGIIAATTSEPINLPTNVVGGLGFFNAQIPVIRLVTKITE